MNSNQLKKLLHERSLKATSARIELLTKMHEFGSAMSHTAIQEAMEPIDRVTLYRTLESLREKGIIHKTFQGNNDAFYAICGINCDTEAQTHEHIHFTCNLCSSVSCIELDENFSNYLPKHQIEKISIHISGICSMCA